MVIDAVDGLVVTAALLGAAVLPLLGLMDFTMFAVVVVGTAGWGCTASSGACSKPSSLSWRKLGARGARLAARNGEITLSTSPPPAAPPLSSAMTI